MPCAYYLHDEKAIQGEAWKELNKIKLLIQWNFTYQTQRYAFSRKTMGDSFIPTHTNKSTQHELIKLSAFYHFLVAEFYDNPYSLFILFHLVCGRTSFYLILLLFGAVTIHMNIEIDHNKNSFQVFIDGQFHVAHISHFENNKQ